MQTKNFKIAAGILTLAMTLGDSAFAESAADSRAHSSRMLCSGGRQSEDIRVQTYFIFKNGAPFEAHVLEVIYGHFVAMYLDLCQENPQEPNKYECRDTELPDGGVIAQYVLDESAGTWTASVRHVTGETDEVVAEDLECTPWNTFDIIR